MSATLNAQILVVTPAHNEAEMLHAQEVLEQTELC